MTRDLLWRGMLAGILGALLATLFARGFAEPQIDRAIGYEESHAVHHPGMPEEEELVSRATQKGAGLVTALALYGAAVGGVFSLVFAYGYGRISHLGPRSFALLLAALTFLLVVIVPALKYPQTPPAVGKHETVALRTAAYFGMIALSLGAAVIAGRVRGAMARPERGFDATLLAAGHLCRHRRRRPVPAPDDRRGSRRFPGRAAVELPRGIDGNAACAVDNDRPSLRPLGGTRSEAPLPVPLSALFQTKTGCPDGRAPRFRVSDDRLAS